MPRLPPRRMTATKRVTLVLDLDETLVHCSVDGAPGADLVFPVNFNGVEYRVAVKLRPHMDKFLRAVADKFEVIVFTASQQVPPQLCYGHPEIHGSRRGFGVSIIFQRRTLVWRLVALSDVLLISQLPRRLRFTRTRSWT